MPTPARFFAAIAAPHFDLTPQVTGDLGRRMETLVRTLFAAGSNSVVLIGADSPTLPVAFIEQAFHELETRADVVIGPATDGGYYLLGCVAAGAAALRRNRLGGARSGRDHRLSGAHVRPAGAVAAVVRCRYPGRLVALQGHLAALRRAGAPLICPHTRLATATPEPGLTMHLSVLLTSLPVPFATALGQARQLGFGYVDVVAVADRPADQLDALAESGLLVWSAAVGKELPPDWTLDAVDVGTRRDALEAMKKQVDDAALLGRNNVTWFPARTAVAPGWRGSARPCVCSPIMPPGGCCRCALKRCPASPWPLRRPPWLGWNEWLTPTCCCCSTSVIV